MGNTATRAGWTRVRFGDVVRLSTERCTDPVAAGIDRYVGLEHLEPGDLRIRAWGNVADGVTFTNRFRPGQVLFGKRRAYQRKVAVAEFDGICSSDIYVFEPLDDRLMLELLPFICQSDGFFERALKTSAGSLSPRTNWTSLADYEFDLPPIEEQQRLARVMIAAQSAVHCLQETGSALHHVASAALASLIPPPNRAMPAGWCVKRLGEVARVVRGSSPRPKGDPRYYGGTVPRLMVEDITRDGRLVTPRIDFLTEAGAKLSRPLEAGTVVVVCSGCVGTPAILAVDACIHDGILGLPDLECDVDPDYLYFALLAAQSEFQRVTTKGGIWNNLTTTILKEFPISLPPRRKQRSIADMLIEVELQIRQCQRRAEATQSLVTRCNIGAMSA